MRGTRVAKDATITPSSQQKLKKAFFFSLKLLITAGLMAIILYKVPLNEMIRRFHAISLTSLMWIFSWLILGFLFSVWRWHSLIETTQPRASFFCTMRGLMLERFLNQAIPTTLSGDIARSLVVVTPTYTFASSFLSVVMDRLYALLGLGISVVLVLAFLPHYVTNPITLLLIFVFDAGIVTCGLLTLFLPISWIQYSLNLVSQIITKRNFPFERLQKLLDLRNLYTYQKPWLFLSCIVLTILVHLCQLRAFQMLAIEMGATSLSYWTTVILITPAFFLATIPISISGWGLREMGVIFMLGQLGISNGIAAGTSIAFGLAYAVLSISCGIAYISSGTLSKIHRNKQITPEENHAS
jgi:uncharacterized membrane protein YbhN (UPF0104 family)